MPWVIEFHVRTEAVTSFHVIVTGQARRRQQMLTWAPEQEIECSAVSCLWPGLVSSHGSAPGLTRAPHSRSSKTIASRQESRHDQTRSRPHTRSATTNGIPVSNSVKIIVDFLENLTYSQSLRLRMQMNVRRSDSQDRSTLRPCLSSEPSDTKRQKCPLNTWLLMFKANQIFDSSQMGFWDPPYAWILMNHCTITKCKRQLNLMLKIYTISSNKFFTSHIYYSEN